MLVDPSTGMPIGNDAPVNANTISGQVGIDMANGLGYSRQNLPLFYDVASSLPSAAATMGWNVSRVQNTIIGGGRRGAQGARGIRQTFSPLASRRLASPINIDPTNSGVTKAYSPFNFLASYGNKGARLLTRAPVIGESLAEKMASYSGGNGDLFSPGTVGRVAAVGRMRGLSSSSMANGVYDSIMKMNPSYYANSFRPLMNEAIGVGASEARMVGIMRGGVSATVSGGISGRVAGFVGAVESPMARGGRAGFMSAMEMLPEGHAARIGAQAGERFLGRYGGTLAGKMIQKGAISGVARAAGPVGWIMLAHDLGLMAGKVAGTGINTMIDAGRSIKGSIDKPVFGMGYTDNSVAATSRQRGVMAISNSRLNMRSALGSEAAMMHAYFG